MKWLYTNLPTVLQNSLTGSQDVSVAIGLQTCGGASCDSLPSETMGTPIFKGDYAPALDAGNDAVSQSFDVQVPASLAPGAARLSVAHFYILGVSPAFVVWMLRTGADGWDSV